MRIYKRVQAEAIQAAVIGIIRILYAPPSYIPVDNAINAMTRAITVLCAAAFAAHTDICVREFRFAISSETLRAISRKARDEGKNFPRR